MDINPREFVEKYKLIPKNHRLPLLDFFRQVPDAVTSHNEYEIFEDATAILTIYEKNHPDTENYTELIVMLQDEAYLGSHMVYTDLANTFLTQLMLFKFSIGLEQIVSFRHKLVMRDILERVAYRPGNPGYEKAMQHFYSLCK